MKKRIRFCKHQLGIIIASFLVFLTSATLAQELNLLSVTLTNSPAIEGIKNMPADFVVKGKVSGGSAPLAGVTVTEKGTRNATTTNADGTFSINVSSSKAILVFTSVGYVTQEVAVSNRSTLNITLESESKEMEAVVVTALGITKSKKALAYSVAEVKSEDIVKASNANLMKSLDGKVSGVNFTNLSSDPTSSVLVNIRGTTALPSVGDGNVALKGQPLFVIDGIPVGTHTFTNKDGVDFGNILSQLNPEDIASVTILKGGSAGALYGSEGGNGVIMITTKSGKGGKKGIGVSYNTSYTWDQPYQFIETQTLYGQGERAYEWQYDNSDVWGPKLDGSFSADYWDVKEQAWKNKPMISYNENRIKAYLQTGNTSTNNVSVFGNYDKGSFRLSLANMNNKGVMPNTKTDQKSINLNAQYKLTDKLRVSVSSSYIRTYSPNKANSVGSNSVLNTLLFGLPPNLQPLSEMKNYWLNGYEGISQNGAMMNTNGRVQVDNPWWTTYEKIHRFTRDNYFGKLQLDWDISNAFSLMLRTGMENVKENYELRQSAGGRSNPQSGQFGVTTNNFTLYNSDVILNFNKNIGKLSINASGGYNYSYSNSNATDILAFGLAVPGLFTINNGLVRSVNNPNDGPYKWGVGQSSSVYGTATFGWDNKLFVDVTGRNDWKGILQEEKINYFYPSVSASWIVSETFTLPKAINFLKLRGAWADVGNGLTRQRSINTYSFESNDWGGVKTVNIGTRLVDPEIKPMRSITKEAGLDIWLLNNRVKFDFTYFIKDQVNQLGDIPTVQGTGFSGMTTNVGDVRSKGIEWGLTVTPVRSRNWNWDVSASFTQYKATIRRLSDRFAPNGYIFGNYDGKTKVKIAVGEEIGNIYEENPILRMKGGKYDGMAILDGDGKVQRSSDERDRAQLGNYNPKFILGLNTTLRYKQFSLSLVGSLRKGGRYISVNQQYMESNGYAMTTLGAGPDASWVGGRDAENGGLPWPEKGASDFESVNSYNDPIRSDFNDASYAKGIFLNPNFAGGTPTDADYIVNGADPNNTYYDFPYNALGDVIWNFTSTRVYDATNFKLREIALSYTLPNALTSRIKLYDITLSVIGRNVFQWNASGRNEDPESAFTGVGVNQGVLRATLPPVRSIGFKLGVNF
ncbi:MAG: SusC/RagA family TonB-linked outer membrane protein [Agriterribacter sp.]